MLTEFKPNDHPIDRLARAEAEWDATVRNLEQQLQSARKILATIRGEKSGLNGSAQDEVPIIPGMYVGQRPIDALENYLRARKGRRIELSKAIDDLLAGGLDAGELAGRSADPRKRAMHNLKIAIPNRTDTFCWEPMVASRKGLPAMPRGTPKRKKKKPEDAKITVWLVEEVRAGKKK